MPQILSRLPREYESPSPDHRTLYTGVVNTVLRYSNMLHLHNVFVTKSVIPWYAQPDSQPPRAPLVHRAGCASMSKGKGIFRMTPNATNSVSNDQHLLDPVRCSRLGRLRHKQDRVTSYSMLGRRTSSAVRHTVSAKELPQCHSHPEAWSRNSITSRWPTRPRPDVYPLREASPARPRPRDALSATSKSPPLIVWMTMLAMRDKTSPSYQTSTAACANRQPKRYPHIPSV